jgi:hypothetical protein
MFNRSLRLWLLAAAVSLLPGLAALAAETPELAIELANNGPNEQSAKDQLERLTKKYDLSRWIFTKKVRIDQRTRPHSHPVLTLNTRHMMNDPLALAGFVHEQIHWFLAKKERETNKAMGDVIRLYPGAPDTVAAGGASGRQSTYLHLIVCQLEFESLRTLLGREQATAVIREEISEGASGLGYNWIYQRVLDDQEQLSNMIRERRLTLPGL